MELFWMLAGLLPGLGGMFWFDEQWRKERVKHRRSKALLLRYVQAFGLLKDAPND